MKHLFIVNPAAGSRDRTKQYAETIHRVCKDRGLDYEIAVSQCPGDCTRIARQAAQSGEEYRLYACGGDGTLNEVAAGAAGYDNAAVTVYAGGSGNDFVRIFDDPKAFFDLELLLDCEEARLDMIRCNGDLSLNICSVGLDARIGTDVARYKRLPFLHGFRAYAVSTVINVIKKIAEHYVIRIDEEVIEGKKTLVCVCNGRFYGGGFNPVPEAQPDDGLLDVLIVDKVSRLKVAQVVARYKKGKYADYPKLIRHFRTDRVEISCREEVRINLDGELRTGKEIEFFVAEEKLRFFYPKGLVFANRAPETVE